MELISSAKRFTYKIIFLLLYATILIWFSIFVYLTIYYFYIPAIAHVRPVHLQYDVGCSRKACKYPSANVTLVTAGYYRILTRGQSYAIEMALEMPESERNKNQGMFMIEISMVTEKGAVVQTSQRPATLQYRSPLFQFIYTVFFSPGLLLGTFEEKQRLVIPLFENYVEDSYRPAYLAHIEVHACSIDIYSAKLQIHAQFTGLRYFMYYWPLFTAVVCVGSIFSMFNTVTLLAWVRFVMISPRDNSYKPLPQRETDSDIEPKTTRKKSITNMRPVQEYSEVKSPLPPEESIDHEESSAMEEESGIEIIESDPSQIDEAESEFVAGLRRRVQ